MKKLLSLILCVALLMGVCASALADRNLQGLLQNNNVLRDKLQVMRTDIIFSSLLVGYFVDSVNRYYHELSKEVMLISASLIALANNEEIKAMLEKDEIDLEDYKKGVSIIQRGVDLLPLIRKYVVDSDEYNKYYATLSETKKNDFHAACKHGDIWITQAAHCLEEVKKMIADGQK